MSTPMRQRIRTPEQQQVVQQLVDRWKLDPERILFLNPRRPTEPWLNYDGLTTIATASGRFRSLSESFSTFVAGLNHIVHTATVVTVEGFDYTRSGVASIGETLFEGDEVDEHDLAATRAMRKALDSAGFNVVKASSIIAVDLNLPAQPPHTLSLDQHNAVQEARTRIKDLRLIHMLAAQKGLIVPAEDDPSRNDMTRYRQWLADNFEGVSSAAGLSPANRSIAINMLRTLADADLRTTT